MICRAMCWQWPVRLLSWLRRVCVGCFDRWRFHNFDTCMRVLPCVSTVTTWRLRYQMQNLRTAIVPSRVSGAGWDKSYDERYDWFACDKSILNGAILRTSSSKDCELLASSKEKVILIQKEAILGGRGAPTSTVCFRSVHSPCSHVFDLLRSKRCLYVIL